MSDGKDDLGDLLSDELGEWDAMFDSLHEDGEPDPPTTPVEEPHLAEPGDSALAGAVPDFIEPITPSGSFDVASTMGARFDGVPGAGTSVDQLVPGDGESSPFGTDEDDFGSLLGSEPEALGGLLGSGPINRGAPAPKSGLTPPNPIDVRANEESVARAKPSGPDDAAFDDFEESTNIVSQAVVKEMAKSAAAFFEDEGEQSNEVSLDLDDDFYDGIQVGDGEDSSALADVNPALLSIAENVSEAAPASPKQRTFAKVVRRDSAIPEPIARETSQAAALAALDSFLDDDEDEATNVAEIPTKPEEEEATNVVEIPTKPEEEEATNVAEIPRKPVVGQESSLADIGENDSGMGAETMAALAPIEDDYEDSLVQQEPADNAFDEDSIVDLPKVQASAAMFPSVVVAPEPEEVTNVAVAPAESLPEALPPIDVASLPQPLPAIGTATSGDEDFEESTMLQDLPVLEKLLEVATAPAVAPIPLDETAPVEAPMALAETAPAVAPIPVADTAPLVQDEQAVKADEPGSLDAALDNALDGLVLGERPRAVTQAGMGGKAEPAIPEFSGEDLAGVVDAAVEDAVAMSTGTLLTGPRLEDPDVEPDLPPEKFVRTVPGPDLGAIAVPEDIGLAGSDRTDEYAQLLVMYSRELDLLDEVGPTMRLRMEAGRIAESLGDLEQARMHFDEALKFDPHLLPANRALRRIERVLGNWEEVIRLLNKELTNASEAEADALTLSRIGLLMAVGELDLARVAVGELLDASPSDARALLANLDLGFVDGREDEIESTLHALSEVLTEPSMLTAVLNYCGSLAEKGGRHDHAIALFGRACEMQPSLGNAMALRGAALKGDSPEIATQALEAARLSAQAPLRAGIDWQRSEVHLAQSRKAEAKVLLLESLEESPEDILLGQQLLRAVGEEGEAALPIVREWAGKADGADWLSQLLGRAGRMSQGTEALDLFQGASDFNRANDFAKAELRREQLLAGQWLHLAEGARASDTPEDALSIYRQAQVELRADKGSEALQSLVAGRESLESGVVPIEVALLDLAYGVNDQQILSSYQAPDGTGGSIELEQRVRSRALTRTAIANVADPNLLVLAADSWAALAEVQGEGSASADISLLVASMTKNLDILVPRLEEAERLASSEGPAIQMAVESAGASLVQDPNESAERMFALQASRPSLRGALLQWAYSLGAGDVASAATALETEAQRLESDDPARADRLLYRAAFLRVQEEVVPSVASDSLVRITERRPEFGAAASLLKAVASLDGATSVSSGASKADGAPAITHDNLSVEIRRAESLARAGDHAAATALLGALIESNPDDALVAYAFNRACWDGAASALLAENALSALRVAEEREDGVAKAIACEELARVDGELRGDYSTALMFWESASLADPSRADLLRTLERELGNQGVERLDSETAWKALGRLVDSVEEGPERSAYLVERARVSLRLNHPEKEAIADFEEVLEESPQCREALFFLEAHASQNSADARLADLEQKVSAYFADDPRARAAFQVRAGETLRGLDQPELAMASFKAATLTMPGFAPALFAWRDMSLDHEMWDSLAEACLLEAESVQNDKGRADLYHLAGVTLMDKAEDEGRAIDAFQRVLVVDALHRDAFVRLRRLYKNEGKDDELAQLFSMRIEVEKDEGALCELHHARAVLMRDSVGNLPEALAHVRAVLALRPNDKRAMVAVSELAWDLEKWAEAAEALMVLARVEVDTPALISVFSKLGTIYTDHLPEAQWALKSFRKVISLDPTNTYALAKFASLSAESGDHKLALGAYEQLIKLDPPIDDKVVYLHKMAESFQVGFNDANKAERALKVALELDLANEAAFDAMIGFYLAQKNTRSARVHMDLVANAMRKRLRKDSGDVVAYHVIAHAMEARFKAGVETSRVVARAAASMAIFLGDTSQAMKSLVASTKYLPRSRGLAGKEHDDLIYPRDAKGGARALLDMLGDRLAKHIGMDVRTHGVGRSDRLKKGDEFLSAIAELSGEMGVDQPEVYLSSQSPLVLAAEPTKPASLVFGKELVAAERGEELRFLAGRLLKLSSAYLSTPLRLGEEQFGVLLVGLLRQFQAEFVPTSVDEAAAAAEQQRLRRLIPSGMLQELAPFALGLASSDFDHKAIWQGLMDAGNRAGLLASGDARAAVQALMRSKGIGDPATAVQDAEIANLIRFACSEDHASLYGALG